MKLIYIATGLENFGQHNLLKDSLKPYGIGITYDWTRHGPVYRDGGRRCREVAGLEAGGVIEADLMVVMLPGGRGTHVELGIAIGANSVQEHPRPIIVYSVPEDAKRFGLIDGPEMCAFYFHGQVQIVIGTLADLRSAVVRRVAELEVAL